MVMVSRQTIVAIERGNYSPSVKLALLLAKVLETTVEELFILEERDYD
jgi:putative transcriptional regulator